MSQFTKEFITAVEIVVKNMQNLPESLKGTEISLPEGFSGPTKGVMLSLYEGKNSLLPGLVHQIGEIPLEVDGAYGNKATKYSFFSQSKALALIFTENEESSQNTGFGIRGGWKIGNLTGAVSARSELEDEAIILAAFYICGYLITEKLYNKTQNPYLGNKIFPYLCKG